MPSFFMEVLCQPTLIDAEEGVVESEPLNLKVKRVIPIFVSAIPLVAVRLSGVR